MSIEEFLKQQAFNIAVNGTYTLDYWYDPRGKPRTFACRTTRISPFRMMVAVPVVGKVGDRITPHFRDFGKLDGLISDTMDGGFLLELDMVKPSREEFASKLSWLVAKQKNPSISAKRKQPRFIPACPHSTLTFADGTVRGCFVIDMSVSGIAVSADVQPQDWNAAGRRSLHRSRRQAFARWLRSQVRRNAESRRSRPAHCASTANFREDAGGCTGCAPPR